MYLTVTCPDLDVWSGEGVMREYVRCLWITLLSLLNEKQMIGQILM